MPWKETSTLEQRKELITRWQAGEETLAELCRQYEISRQTAYTWIQRFERSGESGLEELSRAPHQAARAMPEKMAERIVSVRREHPRWGPRKILGYLGRKSPAVSWPAPSSVGALLKREGLVVGRRKRLRVPSYNAPLAHADFPNRVWCADFKGWFVCADGQRCDPLTSTDACSRFLLRCPHVPKTDGVHARNRAVTQSMDDTGVVADRSYAPRLTHAAPRGRAPVPVQFISLNSAQPPSTED